MKKLIILSLSLLSVSCAQAMNSDKAKSTTQQVEKTKLSAALLVLWKQQHPEMSIAEFIEYLKTKNAYSNKAKLGTDENVLLQIAQDMFTRCTPQSKEDDGLEERISNVLQRQECIESNVQEYIRYLTTKYAYLCAGKEFNEKFESGKSYDTENTYNSIQDEQIKQCVKKNVKRETKMLYAFLTQMIEKQK